MCVYSGTLNIIPGILEYGHFRFHASFVMISFVYFQNYFHADLVHDIWSLVDTWQDECKVAKGDHYNANISIGTNTNHINMDIRDDNENEVRNENCDLPDLLTLVTSTEEIPTSVSMQASIERTEKSFIVGKSLPLSNMETNHDTSNHISHKNGPLNSQMSSKTATATKVTASNGVKHNSHTSDCLPASNHVSHSICEPPKNHVTAASNGHTGNIIVATKTHNISYGSIPILDVGKNSSSSVGKTMMPVDELDSKRSYRSVMHISLSLQAASKEEVV